MFTAVNLAPLLGAGIKADRLVVFDGLTADEIRALLGQRGAFIFRRLHGSHREQIGIVRPPTPEDKRQLQ